MTISFGLVTSGLEVKKDFTFRSQANIHANVDSVSDEEWQHHKNRNLRPVGVARWPCHWQSVIHWGFSWSSWNTMIELPASLLGPFFSWPPCSLAGLEMRRDLVPG